MIRPLFDLRLGGLRTARSPKVSGATVRSIVAAHNREGGCTISLRDGDLAGRPYYAVSPYPERTQRVAGRRLTAWAMRRFLGRNRDLLQDHRHSVGTWFYEERGHVELDVVVTVPSLTEAIKIGRECEQVAIYDLQEGREITVDDSLLGVPRIAPFPQQ